MCIILNRRFHFPKSSIIDYQNKLTRAIWFYQAQEVAVLFPYTLLKIPATSHRLETESLRRNIKKVSITITDSCQTILSDKVRISRTLLIQRQGLHRSRQLKFKKKFLTLLILRLTLYRGPSFFRFSSYLRKFNLLLNLFFVSKNTGEISSIKLFY